MLRVLSILAPAALSLFLMGSVFPTDHLPRTPQAFYDNQPVMTQVGNIHVMAVSTQAQLQKICEALSNDTTESKIGGCAIWPFERSAEEVHNPNAPCTVFYTTEYPDMAGEILMHELNHCAKGFFHGAPWERKG